MENKINKYIKTNTMKKNIMIKSVILILGCIIFLQCVFAEEAVILGQDDMNDINKGLLGSASARISIIFPILLLVISIIAVMIDFGAIGVILGSMGSMMIITWLGLIVISTSSIISFFLLGAMLLYKVAA